LGQDYGNSAGVFLWPDDLRSLAYPETIIQDSLVEPEEDYQLIIVGDFVVDGVAQVLISSDDGDGACGFPMQTIRVKEGEVAYLPVSRLSPGNTEIVGSWRVTSSSGTSGADWTTGSGEFVVPADGTSNTIVFSHGAGWRV
jgi:hypothetical protein